MAERYAVASGNWSSPATWDGGVSLPGAADDVHANGFTVTIDQAITVVSLRTTAGGTAVAGGGFTIGANVTINANVFAGTTSCINVSTAGLTWALNGNVTGGAASNARGINQTVSTTGTITGTITGGSSTNTSNGISWTGTGGVLTVNGDVVGGTTSNGINQTNGTMTINHPGTLSRTGSQVSVNLGANAICTLNGNIGSATNITVTCNGKLQVNGNLIGGSIAGAVPLSLTSGAEVVVIGNLIGGSNATAYAISGATSSITVVGQVSAGAASAINLTATTGNTLAILGGITGTNAVVCSGPLTIIAAGVIPAASISTSSGATLYSLQTGGAYAFAV